MGRELINDLLRGYALGLVGTERARAFITVRLR
jgi:hypothetical protein